MRILNLLLALFLTTGTVALAQNSAFNSNPPSQPNNNNTDEEEEENENIKDEEDRRRFWQASLSGGHYMVALDRICNISMHQYVLDGSLIVNEVTIDTTGRALARFYHIQPVTDAMGSDGLGAVVDRGRDLIERVGQRAGTEVHNMAQKKYPDTTHAGTIEYRILDLRDLDALYGSVKKAWETGKGRRLTIK
ncbi:hypothetical protein HAHE_02610 [Haloferula helveola]|uniref:Uncharacterized protein n=1 Tax=Haloferula helveola TaxID=490095 RepID=A0ABM7RCJ5_9BACT|nr:hypothetical protein HAHE_02610 [Haloferula helveola]